MCHFFGHRLSRSMNDAVKSQRGIIFFLWKEGVQAADIVRRERLNGVFGESAESKSTAYRWMKLFTEGRESLEDDPRQAVAAHPQQLQRKVLRPWRR